MNRLEFKKEEYNGETYYVVKNQKEEDLGTIEYCRVGRFMHWTFNPTMDFEVFFTNGCLKEITSFITKLYGRKNETTKPKN